MERNGREGIVPGWLREIARLLLPPTRVSPQDCGTQNTPDEAVYAAIVHVLVSGCVPRDA
ncbi:hypothetical protein [Nonomuraea sp. CA-141351]|uniref:hypothetical protein n=1 Tax=Nonomuraea sp. CA-141351 TaxID=3239996 RepID=UPI003D93482A